MFLFVYDSSKHIPVMTLKDDVDETHWKCYIVMFLRHKSSWCVLSWPSVIFQGGFFIYFTLRNEKLHYLRSTRILTRPHYKVSGCSTLYEANFKNWPLKLSFNLRVRFRFKLKGIKQFCLLPTWYRKLRSHKCNLKNNIYIMAVEVLTQQY